MGVNEVVNRIYDASISLPHSTIRFSRSSGPTSNLSNLEEDRDNQSQSKANSGQTGAEEMDLQRIEYLSLATRNSEKISTEKNNLAQARDLRLM